MIDHRFGRPGLGLRAAEGTWNIAHSSADIFVGTQFRLWLTGFRDGDVSLWERAFAASAGMFGVAAARDICRDVSHWVRILLDHSKRDLEVLQPDNPCFGRDECVAMALVAAHQHQACPALQVCALTLLACENRSDIGRSSLAVADRLTRVNHVLSRSALDHLVRYAGEPRAGITPHA